MTLPDIYTGHYSLATGGRFTPEYSDAPPLGPEQGSAFSWEEQLIGGYESGAVFATEWKLQRDFQQMLDTDGKAQSVENLLVYPIIAAPREIVSSKGDSGDSVKEKITEILTTAPYEEGMSTPLDMIIFQMTGGMTFKKAFFEKVFHLRDSDGLYGYKKIAWRAPETCELALDPRTGEYLGFRQQKVQYDLYSLPLSTDDFGYRNFPLDVAFVYIHGMWRDPIEGTSAMQVPYWALAHGSKVQTPYGEVNIEDIKVGEEVFGKNGSPTKVLAVHPQGKRRMYRVSLKDGRSVDCDEQHLWGVYNRNGQYKVMSTRQLIDSGLRLNGLSPKPKFSVPSTEAVEYEHKFVPVDPYILGAWLGDGSIGKDRHSVGRYAVRVAASEAFVPEEIERRLPTDLKLVQCRGDYLIRPIVARSSNPLRDALVSMGVNVGAYDKFIPDLYMEGSVKQRLDLLRGLMDTDGSYGHGTGKPSSSSRFHTVSKRLAEGVQRLVRSLGGSAIVRFKTTRNIYTVELLTNESPFLMPRKDMMWKASSRRGNIAIVNIEEVEESECRCITVENEDGLFLTNDYIVTHNCYQTKRRLMYLWYQYLETTSLPKTVVSNNDETKAIADARRFATLKSRGVLGKGLDTTFDILESSGQGASQFIEAIKYLDSLMSQSVLGGFMDLSSMAASGKGSFALSEDQSKLFLRTRRVVAWDMARQFTEQVIAPLVHYNFGPKAPCPKLIFGPMSEANEQLVIEVFNQMVTSASTSTSTAGIAVPDEFFNELTTRVANILELDPKKVAKAIEVDGSPLQRLRKAAEVSLGALQANDAAQAGESDITAEKFLEEAGTSAK